MMYLDIFNKLNEDGIDYLVVGGVALVLHGVVRLTADLDLMIMPSADNLQKLIMALDDLGYKPKLPMVPKDISFDQLREWKKNRNLLVFAFYNSKQPLELVDILIDPVVDYSQASRDKVIIYSGKVEVPIISIGDLIKLKKAASRDQDLADIKSLKNLLRTRGNKYDK